MFDASPQTPSYYAAGIAARPPRRALSGTAHCEVAVIGGGLFGASVALHLASRGIDVVLLEAGRMGAGASGRSGGQLLPGLARGLDDMIRAVGRESAAELHRLTLEGAALARSLIDEHAIDCDFRPGAITAAARSGHADSLRREAEALTDLGHEGLRWLDRREIERALGTPIYFGGLFDPSGAHVNPLKLTLGLADAAERKGARLFENSEALGVALSKSDSAGIEVSTALGMIRAQYAVLACNAAIGNLLPDVAPMVMPVITFMIATEPIDAQLLTHCLPSGACVADTNFVLDYFRRSADFRLIWGGGVSYSARNSAYFSRRLIQRVHSVYPALAGLGIAYSWSGAIDLTLNRLPQIGQKGGRILFAQGFSGHGLILALLLGDVIARFLHQDRRSFELLAGIPHRVFPGGRTLRRPLLVAAALYAQFRNLLE